MVQPGPKSAASLAAVAIPTPRPEPPDDLSEQERHEWETITARLPVDWFTHETFPMLRELCRHIRFARELGAEGSRLLVLAKEEPDPKTAARLWQRVRATLRSHGAQTDRIVSLSTKLRLTKMSRYARADAAFAGSRGGNAPKPWEDWGRPDQ